MDEKLQNHCVLWIVQFMIFLGFYGGIYICHTVTLMVAGSNPGTSPLYNISSSTPAAPVRKTGVDDFLNSENNKNDYDWYVVPFSWYIQYNEIFAILIG